MDTRMAPDYDPPSMSLRPVIESMVLEDIDRAARAYGWEIGRGKNLAETVELSDDNPFKNSNWRELINPNKEQRRPFLCRWGFHSLDDSVLDTRKRWRTICKRCDTLMCYSAEPFIVNGKVVKS